jgi:hypothetical protein
MEMDNLSVIVFHTLNSEEEKNKYHCVESSKDKNCNVVQEVLKKCINS